MVLQLHARAQIIIYNNEFNQKSCRRGLSRTKLLVTFSWISQEIIIQNIWVFHQKGHVIYRTGQSDPCSFNQLLQLYRECSWACIDSLVADLLSQLPAFPTL